MVAILFQLAVMLRRQMDALAAPAPRTHAVLEPGERCVLGLAVRQERADAVQCGELGSPITGVRFMRSLIAWPGSCQLPE